MVDGFQLNHIYKKAGDYVQSPFRYPGGKFYALKYIVPFLNAVPHTEFREPFVGGGSVFFGKQKAAFNWINDIESQLITTYLAIQDKFSCDLLVEAMITEQANKERHNFYKNFIPNDDFELAKRMYYLNRTSYCGIIHKPAWGYADGKSSPPANWGNFLKKAHAKLSGVKITNVDFSKLITEPSHNGQVLLYLDPPYYNADTKRAYIHPFGHADHEKLASLLKNTEHYFCLSYDDSLEVRELYKWANIYERSWIYNTANTTNNRKVGNELIITNYHVY